MFEVREVVGNSYPKIMIFLSLLQRKNLSFKNHAASQWL